MNTPTCEVCGQPSVGAVYFDTLIICGQPTQPAAVASGLHGYCAAHRPAAVPGILPLPPWLLAASTVEPITLAGCEITSELVARVEHEGDRPAWTITYRLHFPTHQVDGDRLALPRA